MKILHINTLDRGGAANACLRLNEELNRQGVESNVLVLNATKKKENVHIYNYWEGVGSRFKSLKKSLIKMQDERYQRHLANSLPAYPGIFTFPETIYDITETEIYKDADIIQLNWTGAFLDEPSFFAKTKKPIVWRMPDLYITGGGPHYEIGFPYDSFKEIINENIDIRKKALSNKDLNLTIVPISNWCKDKAEKSELTKSFNNKIISCGIDINEFKPLDKKLCRQLLGLSLDKKIILFGVDSFTEKRKGAELFEKAIQKINRNDVEIVTFGSGKLDNAVNLGYVQDQFMMRVIYSSADIFVTSAIEEAFGQTSIEAMASGLPLVSFKTGGSLEIFENKKDSKIGHLANDITDSSLFEAINETLKTSYNSQEIIDYVALNFNIEKKASEYINLYKSLL